MGAHASAPNRASPFRRRGPRAAPARRRSTRRRRSTPTSARGTPRVSPRFAAITRPPCRTRYAPLPARRRATAGVPDALGRASMRRGRLCAAAPPMRAHARTCRHSSARASTCVAMAGRRRDSIYVHVFVYIYVFTDIIHIYMYIIESVGVLSTCISVHTDGAAVCAHAVVGLCCRYGSALHMLSSAPGAPSMSLPDLYIATCAYL